VCDVAVGGLEEALVHVHGVKRRHEGEGAEHRREPLADELNRLDLGDPLVEADRREGELVVRELAGVEELEALGGVELGREDGVLGAVASAPSRPICDN